jgi:hypothetical protein
MPCGQCTTAIAPAEPDARRRRWVIVFGLSIAANPTERPFDRVGLSDGEAASLPSQVRRQSRDVLEGGTIRAVRR